MSINQNRGVFTKIYKITRRIPKGKVVSYGQIAEVYNSQNDVKISPRLVGWALHANRDPKIPCHRVVNRLGKLAESYAFDGWQKQKLRLIGEKVAFSGKKHVNPSFFLTDLKPLYGRKYL